MKNLKKKVLSLFSVVLGLFLATSGVAMAATISTVTLSGTTAGVASTGSALTATPNAGSSMVWRWYSSNASTTFATAGVIATTTVGNVYTPSYSDLGKFFKAEASGTVPDIGYATSSAVEITAGLLTISLPTLTTTKVYNGSRTAAVTAGTLSGVAPVDGLNVTVTGAATYDTATTTTDKTITVVYTLAGSAAAGYTKPVNYATTTGIITAKALTIADPTLTLSKVYDGDKTAVVTAGTLSGVVGADTVTVSAVGTYDTATTTTSKTITVVYTLAGADSVNYSKPNNYTSSSGIVTAKQLTIADPTLTTTKNYDGSTSAAVTAGALVGVVGSDTVTVTATGTYNNVNVGTGRGITVAYTLAGADSVNYTKPVDYSVSTGVIVGAGSASSGYYAPAPTTSQVTTPVTPVVTTTTLPANPTQADYQNLISTLLAQVSALQAQLPTATVSGTGYKFVAALSFGNTSDSVKQLQTFLKAQGSDIYPSGATTGYFGQLTQNAVKAFQVKYGLAKTGDAGYGFVGPKTRAKINQLQGM
ncbi:MAG: YDG domain-containing protein [Candidatus Parcubacteria bacterium]|nr:YDG domain-containing protein [Candidatus Parcubacteria bacterium]